jgi:acyl carrier protein
MEKLIDILTDLRPDIDFSSADNLLEGGILDSLDIVVLVGEISDEFNVKISVEDLLPENFKSAQSIMALIKSHQTR